MVAILIYFAVIGFALFCIIYYAVRMGIDSSETSLYVKKIHDLLEERKNEGQS